VLKVINYGAGNIHSVAGALERIGADFTVAEKPQQLEGASAIVLPGVGNFGKMASALDELGLRAPISEMAAAGVPLFGICLGMQMLYRTSDEAPDAIGLGLIDGTVKKLPAIVRCPHSGWNEVVSCGAWWGEGTQYAYFSHSFYVPVGPETAAVTEYGVPISAAIRQGNLFGSQFHPEKSGDFGLNILRSFVEVAGCLQSA
jgi:imidazole glycerol phosphate synthase glutamine amidotransferase subunit